MGTKYNFCELPKDAKVVPDTNDRYYADPLGNIYCKYKNSGYIKMHTRVNNRNGYVYCRAGRVHKLVARAFFGKIDGMEINHKNGNKQDNSVSNLEWCTHSENMIHAWGAGLTKGRLGKHASEETKGKMSEAHKGKCVKPLKVIFNDNTEMIFNSVYECAIFLKVEGNLSNCISGKRGIPKRCNVKEIYYL